MKKWIYRMIAIILSLIIVLTSFEAPVLAEDSLNKYSNLQTNYKEYIGDGYIIKFTLFSSWEGGSNFQIAIENTGDKKIENWYLTFDYIDEINSIWNAQILKHEDGKYIVKNASWNQDIDVGQTVSFGVSASSSFSKFPDSIIILDNNRTDNDNVTIEYSVESNWDTGCTGKILLTNNSEVSIEDWTLELNCDSNEVTFWNGIVTLQDKSHYEIYNAGYNSMIHSGQTVEIGFLVNGQTNEILFSDLKINSKNELNQNMNNSEEIEENDEEHEKEPLADIGENYIKEPTLDDVVLDYETGLQYVKNQLLVSAYLGTPKEAIEALAESINADIVGYTAITCDYQFEFYEDKSLEDLNGIIDYLEGVPFISGSFLNTVIEIEYDGRSNDFLYNDGRECETRFYDKDGDGKYDYHYLVRVTPSPSPTPTPIVDDWNESSPAGDNWNLEYLCVPSAWDLIKDSHPVKVGIIDSYFEDVTYPSGNKELEFDDILRNIKFDPNEHGLGHGVHVAGIIGAKHNNGYGISGVATDVRLYGYTMNADSNKLSDAEGIKVHCIAGDFVALNALICNHVKVINMSLGYDGGEIVCGATYGNPQARNKIDTDAQIAYEHLRKLIDAGYDFLIVKSAGNYNDTEFIADSSCYYGYRKFDSKKDPGSKKVTGVNAQYGYYLNDIVVNTTATIPKDRHEEYKEIQDRIIVVGALKNDKKTKTFSMSAFSSAGSRVDVLAPGQDILSTVPMNLDLSGVKAYSPVAGYKLWWGTSMATPHITGIAALMYQVKPSLSAKMVKQIICDDKNKVNSVSGYNIPNAKLCVETALKKWDMPASDVNWPTGMIAGSIRDSSGNDIRGTVFHVQAIRHSTGEYNMDQYTFDFLTEKESLLVGDFIFPLPQGIYDLQIYAKEGKTNLLPVVIKDVEINPDETTYIETIKMVSWGLSFNGYVTGFINDALTGESLEGVNIKLRKGWNNKVGSYVKNLGGYDINMTTSAEGGFITNVAQGPYTIELEKEGYITAYYNVLSLSADIDNVISMSLTPVLQDDEYRIVLSWGGTPYDLDSHLLYYKDDLKIFHVSYSNKKAYIDGENVATLDLDDTDGFGPETITITVDADLVTNGELKYCVYNYSGGYDGLSTSNATVRIYKGNKLVKEYSVTQNQKALVWHVFNIDSKGIQLVYKYDDIIE